MISSRDFANAGAAGAGAAAALALIIALLLIWLTVKALELVARTVVAHPDNTLLRAAVGTFVVALLAVGLTAGGYAVLNYLAALASFALVIVCKILEVYYAPVLEREWDRDAVAQAVLHEPWWGAA